MPPETVPDDAYRRGLRRREEQLERYATYQSRFRSRLDAAEAISGIGWLYDLLPEASRQRPVDVSGIQELHRCLARLGAGREA